MPPSAQRPRNTRKAKRKKPTGTRPQEVTLAQLKGLIFQTAELFSTEFAPNFGKEFGKSFGKKAGEALGTKGLYLLYLLVIAIIGWLAKHSN